MLKYFLLNRIFIITIDRQTYHPFPSENRGVYEPGQSPGFDSWLHPKKEAKRIEHSTWVNKAYIANKAINNKSSIEAMQEPLVIDSFKNPDSQFKLTKDSKPSYFDDSFSLKNHQVRHIKNYYDYTKGNPQQFHVFVDFANRSLGGGLEYSFVQEEGMFLRFLQLMWLVTENLGKFFVRLNDEGLEDGTPNPLLLRNVKRVLELEGKNGKKTIYGGKELGGASKSEIKEQLTVFAKEEIVKANILALAAVRLPQNSNRATSIEIIQDLFNNILAGFSLLEQSNRDNALVVINTGRFGCGAFNNDYRLVYVIQRIIAEHFGFDIHFHDHHSNHEIDKQAEADYQEVKSRMNSSNDFTVSEVISIINDVRNPKANLEQESCFYSIIQTIKSWVSLFLSLICFWRTSESQG